MSKKHFKNWPLTRQLRGGFGVILASLILVLLFLKIVPNGQIKYFRDFSQTPIIGRGFIANLDPKDRVVVGDESYPQIIGDPAYFYVFTPRTFDRVDLKITYQDNLSIDLPIIEAGVLMDKDLWQYNLQPLSNKFLDYLSLRWSKLEADDLLLLQETPHYSSLSDFQADLAKRSLVGCQQGLDNCLAVYNYDLPFDYQISNYQSRDPLEIKQLLQGPHQFYIYHAPGTLNLEVDFSRETAKSQLRPLELILFSAGTELARETISEAEFLATESRGEVNKIRLSVPNLPLGVYKVALKISDETLIKRIYVTDSKLAFSGRLWLAKTDQEAPLELFTDSNNLQVKVMAADSLQRIIFGEEELFLNSVYRQEEQTIATTGLNRIFLERSGLILANNGVFAFTKESLFNPELKKVDRYFSIPSAPPYIIAKYQKPEEEERVKTAELSFNLQGAQRDQGRYRFMISVPGLRVEDPGQGGVEIQSVELKFSGRTLGQKIKSLLRHD